MSGEVGKEAGAGLREVNRLFSRLKRTSIK